MNSAQYAAIQSVMAELTNSFPALNARQIVAGPLAEFAYGRLPNYSNLTTHNVTNVATAMVGSFVVCYTAEPVTREPMVILVKRGDKGPNGEDRFGVPGGYTNLDFIKGSTYSAVSSFGEQPAEGAVRELREEIVNAAGDPILDIDPARLRIIKGGINYNKGRLSTQYNGHAVELTAAELVDVKRHIDRLHDDPVYRQTAQAKSDGETADVMLLRLQDAANMNMNQFTHQHEFMTLKIFHNILEPQYGLKELKNIQPSFP